MAPASGRAQPGAMSSHSWTGLGWSFGHIVSDEGAAPVRGLPAAGGRKSPARTAKGQDGLVAGQSGRAGPGVKTR